MSQLSTMRKLTVVLAVLECLLAGVASGAGVEAQFGTMPQHGALIATEQGNELSGAVSSIPRGKLSKPVLLNSLDRLSSNVLIATRGAKETTIYKKSSRSVVLIVTNESLGSGVLISDDGKILTNWHVVAGYKEVGVCFKPSSEGEKLSKHDVRSAKVLHVDEVSDLALLQVASVPSGIKALQFGAMDGIEVGEDVNAIGHPTGEAWTFTRGIVSQIRKDYEWSTKGIKGQIKHRADVIQTQTPINPGNSGGPLIDKSGTIIGINSFKAGGDNLEGLNFAVAVDELKAFVKRDRDRYAEITTPSESRVSAGERTCKGRILGKKRNEANNATRVFMDIDCTGKSRAYLEIPDSPKEAIIFCIDTKDTGNIDAIYVDNRRTGHWDYVLYDIHGTGKPDLVGYDIDQKTLEPSRYEKYEG